MRTLEEIRTSLRDYMKSQPEFSEYDFDTITGGMNVINEMNSKSAYDVDVSNTLSGNEFWLATLETSTALFRKAVEIQYPITNRVSSRISIQITGDSSVNVTIPKFTKFASADGTIQFLTTEDVILVSQDGKVSGELYLIQGIVYNYVKTIEEVNEIIRIPNINIDSTTFNVTVTQDVINKTLVEKNNVLFDNSYFVKQIVDGGYIELYCDDNYLNINDIFNVDYLVSEGAAGNDINNITLLDDLNMTNITITPLGSSFGGKDQVDIVKETINMKQWTNAQNRAVTAEDYRVLVSAHFPEFKDVYVFGGEDASPPQYNKVFINVDIEDGFLSDRLEDNIINTIRRYNYLNGQVDVEQAQKLWFNINGTIYTGNNIVSIEDMSAQAQTTVENYFDNISNLFSVSQLQSQLNEGEYVDTSYVDFSCFKKINPQGSTSIVIDYGNQIITFKTSNFVYKNENHYIEYVNGSLNLYKATGGGILVKPNVGDVSSSGIVTIFNVEINEEITCTVNFVNQDIKKIRNNTFYLSEVNIEGRRL
jgi:hypothetical protein